MADPGATSDIGSEVIRFLEDHDLEHSPANYAFGHRFLFERDDQFAARVREAINQRPSLTPAEVRRLDTEAVQVNDLLDRFTPRLDEVTIKILSIIRGTLDASGTLSQELIQASTSLLVDQESNIRIAVNSMIAVTAAAEKRLVDAMQQAHALRQELSRLRVVETHRDPLTGLVNRTGLDEHLKSIAGSPYCAAFIDVDQLEHVNEAHGTAVGDRVLQVIATNLAESCAPYVVCRWEGGRFLILLERLDLASSVTLVDDARSRLAKKRMRVRESDQPLGTITFSAGVAASRGRDAGSVFGAAEVLLELAKRCGRNVVMGEHRFIDVGSNQ
ncbi:GGDEF domain-containing protein [Sphingomonas psychrotolerans]|nr:GGDEF domain-containing protein [Sphingomonas psychrotolerans]